MTPELLMRLLRPSEAALSRDGRQIAFAVSESFSEPDERPRSRISFVEGFCSDRTIVTGPALVVELESGEARELPSRTSAGSGGATTRHFCMRAGGDSAPGAAGSRSTDPTRSCGAARPRSARATCRGSLSARAARPLRPCARAPGRPPEVVLLEDGSWRAISRLNDELATSSSCRSGSVSHGRRATGSSSRDCSLDPPATRAGRSRSSSGCTEAPLRRGRGSTRRSTGTPCSLRAPATRGARPQPARQRRARG